MALYISHSTLHLARLLYVRPETFGPYYVILCFTYCGQVRGSSVSSVAFLGFLDLK